MSSMLFASMLMLGISVAVFGSSEYDFTLKTVGRSCMDKFDTILADIYSDDKACQDAITSAWSSPGKNCPSTKTGSQVQKCLSKSQASVKRWTEFVKDCEIMNVAVRDETQAAASAEGEAAPKPSSNAESEGAAVPNGEAGGEHSKPSCFPAWEEIDDFEAYLEGKTGGSTMPAFTALFFVALACVCAAILDAQWS